MIRMLYRPLALVLVLSLAALAPPASAQDLLAEFEEKVTEFELDNGLQFIVIERRDAPVVSVRTRADVGSVDEESGLTGLAHMFEHMAFKGTTTVGTTSIEDELEALRREEEIFQRLRRERARGPLADPALIEQLEAAFAEAQEAAKEHIEQNEFDRILQQAGAVGMNATTSADATNYFYSLPSNRLELFFALESDRFLNPVLREFYPERDVVMEERRMRTESQPVGRLIEEFLTTAFKAHPYGQPTVGHMADLQALSRTDAEAFFERYYNASNLTIALAGDVDPAEVRRLAEQYFDRLPAGEKPPRVWTEEPEQLGERRVVIEEQTQPFVIMGYHRPSINSPDDVVYDVLADVLGRGRTSRLHETLVESELALQSAAIASFPGNKYASLFMIYGVPNRGVDPDTIEAALTEQVQRIAEEGITEQELERAKTRARADLIQGLDSNTGLASVLTTFEVLTGDWRNFFRQMDALEALTVEDVQRVAAETFERRNRTVAMIRNAETAS